MSTGNVDPLFGTLGQVVLPLSNARINALAVLNDGNDTTADPILLAGQSGGSGSLAFTVARLTANGSPDPSFAPNHSGVVTVDFGGEAAAQALAVQPDHAKFIVGGYAIVGGQRDFALARLNANGSLDTSFNNTGKLLLDLGGAGLNALALERDGSVLAVGSAPGGGDPVAIHVLNDGTLDHGFAGGSGVFRPNVAGSSNAAVRGVALQGDGKIVLASDAVFAHASGPNQDILAVRLNADGTLDNGFASGGVATLDFGKGNDTASSVLVQANGKIVVAGGASNGRFDFLALARLSSTGALDPTFGAGVAGFGPGGTGSAGTVVTAIGAGSDIAFALTQQPDGKLVVAGRALLEEDDTDSGAFTVARYRSDGAPDTTFGLNGHITTTFGDDPSAAALALGASDNGQLVAAGVLGAPGATQAVVVRYQADIRPIVQSTAFTVTGDGFSQPILVLPLNNDFEPNGNDPLTIARLSIPGDQTNPTNRTNDRTVLPGQHVTAADGSTFFTDGTAVSITPPSGFQGTFTVYYTATDGWLSAEARISINVSINPINLRAGSNDPQFGGSDHRVVTHVGYSAVTPGATVVQPAVPGGREEKLVVASLTTVNGQNEFVLTRYNESDPFGNGGHLDTAFGGGGTGIVTTAFANLAALAPTVAVQADGSILVAGAATVGGHSEFVVVRFTPDGSLDTTFGTGGEVVTAFNNLFLLSPLSPAVAVQADDSIVVAGGAFNLARNIDFAAVRFTPNGVLDPTFGTGGLKLVDFSGGAAVATAVLIDGTQIVLGGLTTAPTVPGATGQGQNFAVARLNSNGSLDTGFGTGGSGAAVTDVRGSDILRALALDNGAIVAVGTADNQNANGNRDFGVVRYTATGALDPTFNAAGSTPGVVTVDFQGSSDEAYAVAVQPADNNIVVAGYATVNDPNSFAGPTNTDFALVRLNPDGTFDTNFGQGGMVTTDFIGLNDAATGVVLQSDGKIVAAGSAADKDLVAGIGLVRYNADGSVDTTFGGRVQSFGLAAASPGVGSSAARATAVQSNGSIVVAGTANDVYQDDFALVRFTAEGNPDPTFPTVLLSFGGTAAVNALVVQPNDNIVAAGFATIGGRREFALARFGGTGTIQGTLDSSFGSAGTITLAVGDGDAVIASVAIDNATGNLFVAGTATQNGHQVFALAEFDASGNLVPTFGSGGVVLTDLGDDASVGGLVLQPGFQGGIQLVVVGTVGNGSNADVALARYNSDGSLDTSFGNGGTVRTNGGGADSGAGVALQPDGKIVVVGTTTPTQGGSNPFVIRYLPNGQLDASFGPSGNGIDVLTNLSPTSTRGLAIVINTVTVEIGPNFRIVIAGAANVLGQDRLTLVRLLPSGQEDPTFASNGKLTFLGASSGQFDALAIQFDPMTELTDVIAAGTATLLATGGPTHFVVGRFLSDPQGFLPPLAVPDTASTAENQSVAIPVLNNDQNPESSGLTVSLPSSMTSNGGTVVVNADNTVSYTPAAGFTGTDTFTYQANSGFGSFMATATATVTVTVTAPPPVAAAASSQPGLVTNESFLALGGANAAAAIPSVALSEFGGQSLPFLVLTNGSVSSLFDAGTAGVDNGTAVTVQYLPGGATVNRGLVFNATVLDLTIDVPTGDNFLSFDFAFLTNEFPNLAGRTANDGFIAELDRTTWHVDPVTGAISAPDNFAFDPMAPNHDAVSVRSSFFNPDRVVTQPIAALGGGTPQLEAGTPITPGIHHLVLSIFGGPDSQLKGAIGSAVLLRNLHTSLVANSAPGATQPPIPTNTLAPLTAGQPTTVAVLQGALDFDNRSLTVTAIAVAPLHGTATVDPGGQTITYTPDPGYAGTDVFTYTIANDRGQVGVATVTLLPTLQSAVSRATAPTDPLNGIQPAGGVASGSLVDNTQGDGVAPLTVAQYASNPVGGSSTGLTFFDVQSLNVGTADKVVLIVDDPTGSGQLMYYSGVAWHEVRSSGDLPPTRLPDGRLMVILDAFSFPRITGLLGTPFSIPVTTTATTTTATATAQAPSTATVSTPVAQAGSSTTSTTTEVTFRDSDSQLAISLTSTQSTQVQSSESTTGARLNQAAQDEGGDATAGGRSSPERASGGDSDVSAEVLWVYELHPEVFAALVDLYVETGRLDDAAIGEVLPQPVWLDTTPPKSEIRNPKPETLAPKSSLPNPKPEKDNLFFSGFGFRISDFEFGSEDFGFWVSGLGEEAARLDEFFKQPLCSLPASSPLTAARSRSQTEFGNEPPLWALAAVMAGLIDRPKKRMKDEG